MYSGSFRVADSGCLRMLEILYIIHTSITPEETNFTPWKWHGILIGHVTDSMSPRSAPSWNEGAPPTCRWEVAPVTRTKSRGYNLSSGLWSIHEDRTRGLRGRTRAAGTDTEHSVRRGLRGDRLQPLPGTGNPLGSTISRTGPLIWDWHMHEARCRRLCVPFYIECLGM